MKSIFSRKKLSFTLMLVGVLSVIMLVATLTSNIAKAEPANESYSDDIIFTLSKAPTLGSASSEIEFSTNIGLLTETNVKSYRDSSGVPIAKIQNPGLYYVELIISFKDKFNNFFSYTKDDYGNCIYDGKVSMINSGTSLVYTPPFGGTCGHYDEQGEFQHGDPAYSMHVYFSFEIPEVSKHTVSGRIVDKDGVPQSGADVWACPVDEEGSSEASWAQTDDHGNYSLELTEGKNYILDCYTDDSMYSDITTGVLTNDKVMDDIYIYQKLSEEGLKATLSDWENCKLKICAVKPFTEEVIITEDGPLERYINSGEEEVLEELINTESVFKYNISGNKIILQNDYIQNFGYWELEEVGPLDIEIVAEPNDGYEVSSWDVIPTDYVNNSLNSQSGYVTQDLTFKANIQPIPPQPTTDPESYNVAQTGDMSLAIVAGLCIIAIAAGTTLLIRKRKLNK